MGDVDLEYRKVLKESGNENDKLLYETFISSSRFGYIELGPQKYIVPEPYLSHKDEIDNFQVLPQDVMIMTHPKTGTTWLHEMVWLLKNNLDYKKATEFSPTERVPYLDLSILFNDSQHMAYLDNPKAGPDVKNSIAYADTYNHPRVIKTHLPWELMPKAVRNASEEELNDPTGFKVIYCYRNPGDVCVSYYHFLTGNGSITGSLNDFAKLFISGRLHYGPYFKHIESCYKHRHHKNILLVSYEEMKKDLKAVIKQVANFIGKQISESDVDKLFEFLQFDNMKNLRKGNDSEYKSYRSGRVGKFKQELTDNTVCELTKWAQKEMEETKMDLPNLLIE